MKGKRDFNTLLLTTDKEDLDELLELRDKYQHKLIDLRDVVLYRLYRNFAFLISGDEDDTMSIDFLKQLQGCERTNINFSKEIITIEFIESIFNGYSHKIEITPNVIYSDDFKIVTFWSEDVFMLSKINNLLEDV